MAATMTAENELVYSSFPIEKVEQTADGHVMVWGKATDESLDSDQQIIDAKFAAKAMDEFFDSGPNIRVQHQAQRDPAGVGVSFERDGDAHWLKSKIIEPVAKQLVLGGALRAYSVGIARPTIQRDSVARGGRITDGQFVEISLVDRPANKNCGISLVKADKDGHAEWIGKVFGSGDLIQKAESAAGVASDVTLTLPSDVTMGFSPLDMARILARRPVQKSDTMPGGVPSGSVPKGDGEDEAEKGDTMAGAVPGGSMPKEDDAAEVEKTRLDTETRNDLPDSAFAIPSERAYPIHDKSHARNALSRVSENGTPEEKAKVRAAVAARYPGMGSKKKDAKKAAAVAQDALKKDKAVCTGCGAKQNTEHDHCSECGASMAGAMPIAKNHDFMCLKCGNDLDKGEKFCTGCGTQNPGYNPMADLKIPANKAEGSRVAELPADTTETAPEPVVKAKKMPHDPTAEKCGCKACMKPEMKKAKKKGNPFGDKQAPPFGKDPDDAKPKKAKKVNDAPVTSVKGKKKAKMTPMPESVGKGGFGHTASPGDGVTGERDMATVPAHREPDGLDVAAFEHSAGLPTDSSGDRQTIPAVKGGKLSGPKSEAIAVDTSAPGRRGKAKKVKGPKLGQLPAGHSHSLPGHRDGAENQEFDRMASKFDADPDGTTQVRLKSVGADTVTGYAHDLVCPAFSWDQVAKAYPAGMGNFDADSWQQKALEAAASAPLDEAKMASQLGQVAFTIKSASADDLIDVKNDMYKAFRDANPGPGSFPTPGHLQASSFRRPNITTGRAAYSHQYGGPNSANVPDGGGIAASSFSRDFMQAGRAEDSPSNKGVPYPQETGVHMNLDYSSVHKNNIAQAFTAMHSHFDRTFPGVCPMNSSLTSPPARSLAPAQKADDGEVTKKVSADGMTKKDRRKLEKKLTKKVMKGKMPLDQARIRMGKKPKTSPEPLKPQKAAEPDVTKTISLTQKDMAKAFAAELRKAQKTSDKKIAALTKAVNILADQPDPSTQAFKGMALNHPIRKAASPAGVQEIADNAARTQAMILAEMEYQARNNTDPTQREAAWTQVCKMKGLTPIS